MRPLLLALVSSALLQFSLAADAPMPLWPSTPPGDTGDIGEEADQKGATVAGKPIIRLGNVSKPMLTVYRPAADKNTGAAIVVCPGGGYNILAYDLEGTEVCEWLAEQGVTGVLLKYRVPGRKGREKHEAPLQDAQRAISLTRQHAAEWGVDPNRIGILGFSAGGHLAAVTSRAERSYPPVDDADKQNHLPNFSVLIYPAYLTAKEGPGLEVQAPVIVDAKTPPAFIAMTLDDPVRVEGAFAYARAMKAAKVPCELHVYPSGGHGYGLRRTDKLVTTWPDRLADWMKSSGLLKK